MIFIGAGNFSFFPPFEVFEDGSKENNFEFLFFIIILLELFGFLLQR